MSTTFYTYSGIAAADPVVSDVYTNGGFSITVTGVIETSSGSNIWLLNLTGDLNPGWETEAGAWTSGGKSLSRSDKRYVLFSIVDQDSDPLLSVTGVGAFVGQGLYLTIYASHLVPYTETFTPAKVNYTFDPSSVIFTTETRNAFVEVIGTFVGPPSKPTNPTPTNTGTGIVLLPTLSWQAG